MDIKNLEKKARRDFNNAVCLMGIIPFLVFVYVMVERVASFKIFAGEIGYIMFAAIAVFLSGIIIGKRILWALITNLISFNRQLIKMQEGLIEKNRLAAISETALALSHEINNPLMVVRGNIELLETDLLEDNIPSNLKGRLAKIRDHCERIREVTDKMTKLKKPVSTDVYGDAKMIDLGKSE